MTDYVINQVGYQLTGNTIKISKYENKVSRLVFNLDNTIDTDQLHLFVSVHNPKTSKVVYSPILKKDDIYYFTIGSEISMYVGRWTLILLGISKDYDLAGMQELDDSAVLFPSLEYKKLVVLDAFLDDDNLIVTDPNVEECLQDLYTLHENITQLSIQTGEDATECGNILQQCQNILNEINRIFSHMNILETSLVNRYEELLASLQSHYSTYLADLRRERLGGGE